MRNFVLWLAVFLAGLLVGFIPQYVKAHHFEEEYHSCNASLELAQIRQSASLMYVSATQLNYGLASEYANQFFSQVQQLAGSTRDAGVRSVLSDILSSRDKIVADLAKGNSEVVSELQPILLKVEQGANK